MLTLATVIHMTRDSEDRARDYLPLQLKYSALRNIATANRPITEWMDATDCRPATQGARTFAAAPEKNKQEFMSRSNS